MTTTPQFGLNTTARDVTFHFDDSCNCCFGRRRKWKDRDVVSLNDHNEVIRLATPAGHDFASIYERIQNIVLQHAKDREMECQTVLQDFKSRLNFNLDNAIKHNYLMNYEMLKSINTAMSMVFSPVTPPVGQATVVSHNVSEPSITSVPSTKGIPGIDPHKTMWDLTTIDLNQA